MREEIIVSGRANPLIDPHLHIWHWQIPLYLFLGGLAAGILFFAGLYTIMGKEDRFATAVRKAPHLVPFILVMGLFALFLDLKHQAYFWRLYTTIRLQSPMSWGAWVLMLVTPVSIIWSAIHINEIFPRWQWKSQIFIFLDRFFRQQKLALAWIMVISSVILGVYTGILFSAFNARRSLARFSWLQVFQQVRQRSCCFRRTTWREVYLPGSISGSSLWNFS
jgi:protein NrfD